MDEYQCEATLDCKEPREFMDEGQVVYCHTHMVEFHGPCGDDCTSSPSCPSHRAWLEYIAEKKSG